MFQGARRKSTLLGRILGRHGPEVDGLAFFFAVLRDQTRELKSIWTAAGGPYDNCATTAVARRVWVAAGVTLTPGNSSSVHATRRISSAALCCAVKSSMPERANGP